MHQEVMMVVGLQTNLQNSNRWKNYQDGVQSYYVKKKQQKCEREKTDEIRNDKAVWAEEEIFKRRIVVTKRKGKIS